MQVILELVLLKVVGQDVQPPTFPFTQVATALSGNAAPPSMSPGPPWLGLCRDPHLIHLLCLQAGGLLLLGGGGQGVGEGRRAQARCRP